MSSGASRHAFATLALASLAGCASTAGHPRADARWLVDGRSLSVPAPAALPEGRPLRVAVYGDAHGSRESHRRIVAAIREMKPDLVIYTGDATDCYPSGHLPDWGTATYFVPWWPQEQRGQPAFGLLSLLPFPALWHETVLRPIDPPRTGDGMNAFLEESWPLRGQDGVPFLFAPGNHDEYHRQDREDVARVTGASDPARLWRSVDIGSLRILLLDGGADLWGGPDPLGAGSDEEKWLAQAVAEAEEKKRAVIAVLHYPPFSSAAVEPPSKEAWRVATQILMKHGVALVLSGHAHAYERIEEQRPGGSTTFLVSGGGDGRLTTYKASRAEPGSRKFVEGVNHFVWLEIGPSEIRGKMIPVDPGERLVPNWHERRDEFVVPIAK